MQVKKLLTAAILACACAGTVVASPVWAEATKAIKTTKGKVYNEMEFLHAFKGKSRQQVSDVLGKPERREQSVKPSDAEGTMGRPLDASKPVNVEMWYYKNIVEYAKKKTYKITELTFVNDHCANIAFFNNQ